MPIDTGLARPSQSRASAGDATPADAGGRAPAPSLVLLLAAAALCLLGAAGLHARPAAGDVPSWLVPHSHTAGPTTGGTDPLLTVGLGLAAGLLSLLVIGLVWRLVARGRKSADMYAHVVERPPTGWFGPAALAVVAAFIALTIRTIRWLTHSPAPATPTLPTAPAMSSALPSPTLPAPVAPLASGAVPPWVIVLLVVAGLVLIVGGAVGLRAWLRRRFGSRGIDELLARVPGGTAPVASTPNASATPSSEDPRKMVLQRYREFEQAVQAHGVVVMPSDTAGDVADRTTDVADAAREPVSGLTDLFRLVRYSSQRIETKSAEDAAQLLRAVRDRLEEP